jgi:hypothetical protein
LPRDSNSGSPISAIISQTTRRPTARRRRRSCVA